MNLLRLAQRCVLLLLLVAGSFPVAANPAAAEQSPVSEASIQWRRTANGWERADLWNVGSFAKPANRAAKSTGTAPAPLPAVHPVVIAGFLLAAAGLLALPNRPQKRQQAYSQKF